MPRTTKVAAPLYDTMGNGIAVGSVLVGFGLSNAGRYVTVTAISPSTRGHCLVEEHLTGRVFWTFAARSYRVADAGAVSL